VRDVVPADGGSGARCAGNTGGRRLYAGNVGGATATAGTGCVGGAGNGNLRWGCGQNNAAQAAQLTRATRAMEGWAATRATGGAVGEVCCASGRVHPDCSGGAGDAQILLTGRVTRPSSLARRRRQREV
jgi:hypothetical protein